MLLKVQLIRLITLIYGMQAGIRPVIILTQGALDNIVSGDGMQDSPYVLAQ